VTARDRTKFLRRNGYSADEAAFLCLVAEAGGYFLRRHYRTFRGTKRTRAEANLTDKLVTHRHAKVYLGPRNVELFHLSSRWFYRLIGADQSRNRRRRPESAIRRRLLTLDYVLASREGWLLTTDAEKIHYFETLCRVPRAFLMLKNGQFIDRQPILIGPKSVNHTSVVSFSHIESQPFNPHRFRSFFRRHRYIWECLGAVRLVYVTDRKWNPVLAEREFRALADRSFPAPSDPKPTLRQEIRRAFRAKREVETGLRWSLADRDRHLVESLQWRLRRQVFEALYDEWLLIGDQAVYESIPPDPSELRRPPDFEALFVDADYSFLTA
jgi:hypothetical protein